ncbi:hypothetical protein ACFPAF_00435 [Hymenobacter endophyticus]|uniref:DUF2335 domain-containing protein n=1 Tax=Hymenobacter endophyticus TaxID=3076335 RepID=A0ABU3TBU7_9BACT|nr:hypothetical protein [Hymenobacter endophyticus]MDU0368845.1 hypothetical protein [Hymenobacter endophyticus]
MYREKYAQGRALHLYTTGRPQEVLPMLLEEGAPPEQAEQLALKYLKMQRLLATEDARKQLKTSQMLVTVGAVFLAGGMALTLLSLLFLGGSYVIYLGVLLFGAGVLIKGTMDKQAARKRLQTSST